MVGKRRISKGKKQSKFVYYLLAPVRILRGAIDFYTNTLCDCAGRISHGSMVVGYTALPHQISHLPRTFSGTSSSSVKESKDIEDLRELIRVMTMRNNIISTGNNYNRMETDSRRRLRAAVEGGGSGRSYSFGVGRIGRIDEDMPCDFMEVVDINKNNIMYPRCRSYAITNRNVVF